MKNLDTKKSLRILTYLKLFYNYKSLLLELPNTPASLPKFNNITYIIIYNINFKTKRIFINYIKIIIKTLIKIINFYSLYKFIKKLLQKLSCINHICF